MQLPTIEESVRLLEEVSGVEGVDPDVPIQSSGVDSLNLVEWVYEMQERHPGLAVDETIVDEVDETTSFRAIHEKAVGGVPLAADGS